MSRSLFQPRLAGTGRRAARGPELDLDLARSPELALFTGFPELRGRHPRLGDNTGGIPVAARKKTSIRKTPAKPRVAILMGSANDWEKMKPAAAALEALGVATDVRVISAHRTPERHARYVKSAEKRGIEVFICGAGMAAHLAGVTAALTTLPVLGVPLDGSAVNGMDALLATVQMPGGIPVATFAIGKAGAKNAGLFAGQILSGRDARVRKRFQDYRKKQTAAVPERP